VNQPTENWLNFENPSNRQRKLKGTMPHLFQALYEQFFFVFILKKHKLRRKSENRQPQLKMRFKEA